MKLSQFDPPPTPDWLWLIKQQPEQIAQAAARLSCPAWLGRWWTTRWFSLPNHLHDAWPKPHDKFRSVGIHSQHHDQILAPVANSRDGYSGGMTLLRISPAELRFDQSIWSDTDNRIRFEDRESMKQTECAIHASLQKLNPDLRPMMARPYTPFDVTGDSLTLPAAMLILAHHLGLALPTDLTATGGSTLHNNQLRFTQPDFGTLASKMDAARMWGCATMLVPCDDPDNSRLPQGCAGIGTSLFDLIAAILLRCKPKVHAIGTLNAIALLDVTFSRLAAHREALDATMVDLITHTALASVQEAAYDLRCKIALHNGNTKLANAHARESDRLASERSDLRPPGSLGDYYLYDRAASRSILMIDLGLWQDDLATHKRLNRLIASLTGDHWPTESERFALYTMQQTRARRKLYAARFTSDESLRDEAISDMLAHHDSLAAIIDYAQNQLGRNDTTIQRHTSLIIDAAVDLKRAGLDHMKLASQLDLSALPHLNSPLTLSDPWALLDTLKWRFVQNQELTSTELQLIQHHATHDKAISYPINVVFEWAAYLTPSSQDLLPLLKRSYDTQLSQICEHPGIGSILALRTWKLLHDLGCVAEPPPRPDVGKLGELYDNLIIAPESIATRCPY